MGGKRGGIEDIMKDKLTVKTRHGNAFAPYMHCPPHKINLVIVRAAETKAPIDAINFLAFVQEMYNFFNDSNKKRIYF